MTLLALIAALALRSVDFVTGAMMPMTTVYTGCGGKNASPALRWSDVPTRTRSFILTVHDIDAPKPGGFWHWIAYNIPPAARGLAADGGKRATGATGTFATNDFGNKRYDGPCPPPGHPHRYVFTIYALTVPHVMIGDGKEVQPAIKGRVIEYAQLIGRWGRSGK